MQYECAGEKAAGVILVQDPIVFLFGTGMKPGAGGKSRTSRYATLRCQGKCSIISWES
ncbi:MAG: hypothetical protein WCX63_07705 [Methanoregula sp.]